MGLQRRAGSQPLREGVGGIAKSTGRSSKRVFTLVSSRCQPPPRLQKNREVIRLCLSPLLVNGCRLKWGIQTTRGDTVVVFRKSSMTFGFNEPTNERGNVEATTMCRYPYHHLRNSRHSAPSTPQRRQRNPEHHQRRAHTTGQRDERGGAE